MLKKTPYASQAINKLPEGCALCVSGNKLVLFITGKCPRKCYYCPLPEARKDKDIVWANERKLSNVNAVNEAIEEAKLSDARGMGITGGDPLVVVDRVCRYVRAFKKKFGKNFHVHIYLPTLLTNKEKLEKLAKSGIDEVRFHPDFMEFDNPEVRKREIGKIQLANKLAGKYKWKVGCEIPVVPKTEKQIITFIKYIKDYILFLNLNELETSVLNARFFLKKGFSIYTTSAVKGSQESALKVLKWADNNLKSNERLKQLHYCSAATKNLFQYKNRLVRRLKNIFKPYDQITKDNDLFRGAIYIPKLKPRFKYSELIEKIPAAEKAKISKKLDKIRKKLMNNFNIPARLIEVDKVRLRILTSAEIAEKLKKEIKSYNLVPAIVEEIPAYDEQILDLKFLC